MARPTTGTNLNNRNDDFFEVEIRDNGIGFSTEHLADIFRLFQRLYPKRDFKGTGLGLDTIKLKIHF